MIRDGSGTGHFRVFRTEIRVAFPDGDGGGAPLLLDADLRQIAFPKRLPRQAGWIAGSSCVSGRIQRRVRVGIRAGDEFIRIIDAIPVTIKSADFQTIISFGSRRERRSHRERIGIGSLIGGDQVHAGGDEPLEVGFMRRADTGKILITAGQQQ